MPSMEEFSNIFDEKLKAHLGPIQSELKALKEENISLRNPALIRKKHLDQQRAEHAKWLSDLADELKAIEDGS